MDQVGEKLAEKLGLKSGFLKCTILDAEPVNSITGEVVVEQNDFVVEGRFPLVWDRYYGSQKAVTGVIGQRWQCPADIRLEVLVDQGELGVVARFPDHETVFSLMPIEQGWDERVYDWQQGTPCIVQVISWSCAPATRKSISSRCPMTGKAR